MSVRILANKEDDTACMYCSTSDWAFGPIFGNNPDTGKTASERVLQFLNWLEHNYGIDPRRYTDTELSFRYGDFLVFESERKR